MENYKVINQKWWDDRVKSHYQSNFYDVKSLLNGKSSLNEPELKLLGDIKGKRILHLQCHFGLESISLARLGAEVTAIDFSQKAIETAKGLNIKAQTQVNFICCDVYEVHRHVQNQFDLVFTSYGTVIWLPDLDLWAKQIAKALKPNGHFIFADFHPFVWMMDDEMEHVQYPYSSTQAIDLEESSSYASEDTVMSTRNITWNHGLSDVFNALKAHHLKVTHFKEYLNAPYPFLSSCIKIENNYQIQGKEGILPLMYTMKAIRS